MKMTDKEFYASVIKFVGKYLELKERIDKAVEYLKRLQEKELITEFETGWLIELLEGDKDE